jgi:antitoxin component of RelBE/YafQ-DinJ toxin-antitoxin module
MTTTPRNNDTNLNIRIPTALHEQLKVVADTLYMPVSVMVRLALADYVRNHATTALAQINTKQDQSKKDLEKSKNPSQRMYESWTPEEQKQFDDDWNY